MESLKYTEIKMLTHPIAILKFLEEQGFEFEFYSKWGYNYLEIGGLQFDDGIGVLKKIYELVHSIQGEGRRVPSEELPFVIEQTRHNFEDIASFQKEIEYLHNIGLRIFITDNHVLTRLGPFHYPRIEIPIHMNTLGWEGVVEYETAKSFVHSLYSAFSNIT